MLASDLHYAARHGGIELYYQPQMKADGTPFGGEALLRWKHPSAGFLYPPLVIALAREDHFLDELGLLLIEQACRDFKRLEEACPVPLDISVNITPDQLNRPDFTGRSKSGCVPTGSQREGWGSRSPSRWRCPPPRRCISGCWSCVRWACRSSWTISGWVTVRWPICKTPNFPLSSWTAAWSGHSGQRTLGEHRAFHPAIGRFARFLPAG